jgi:hypothetical protein
MAWLGDGLVHSLNDLHEADKVIPKGSGLAASY